MVRFIRDQAESAPAEARLPGGPADAHEDIFALGGDRAPSEGASGDDELEGEDPLYGEAKDTVVKAGKASASYLQRRLKIGYARAARLLDLMEERGIIGPGEGAKPREILVKQEPVEN